MSGLIKLSHIHFHGTSVGSALDSQLHDALNIYHYENVLRDAWPVNILGFFIGINF